MKHFWHATAEQPPSSSRTSRVQGSNTGITAIACIKAGSLCAWSLGDSLWSHGMRMVETTYISLITYNYGLHIIMNNDILYDQLIMFTTGILWLLIIPPLLVHAIIWYMYILIYIYIYDGDPEIGQYHSPFPWRYHIPLLPSPLHPEQS